MTPAHARLRFGGNLFSADHHWSVGLNVVLSGGFTPDTDGSGQAYLEGFRDAVRAQQGGNIVGSNLLQALSAQGTITYVRTSLVGTNGKEVAVAQTDLATPITGTGQAVAPAQLAIVLSLLTGRPGASYRGRMYWPALRFGLGASGGVNDGAPPVYAADAAQLIQDVRNSAHVGSITGVPSVVSNTKGTASAIQSVRVGNRLDVQRRRAEGQKESYSGALVAQ